MDEDRRRRPEARDPVPRDGPARMEYRRFGRTGLELSCVTLGGMRFRGGGGEPRDVAPDEGVEHCAGLVREAQAAGINHFETAWGYGRSEHIYGKTLNEVLALPRDSYYLMTKGNPETGDDTRRTVELQLAGLRTDRIDCYAWHGINNGERRDMALAPGGPVETLLALRDEGVIGHVGFSGHGPVEIICDAIASGLFEFVNLHYYYFFQRNRGAVDYAGARDMGVFIISPNHKGGCLYGANPQLRARCAPLTPVQWNARWLLADPRIATLSFGMTEPEHFDEMRGIFPTAVPLGEGEYAVQRRLEEALAAVPHARWEGWEMLGDPSGINIPEILRFRRMWRCWGMEEFVSERYNMFQERGHWFPGAYATEENLARVDAARAPAGIPVVELLREVHERFYRPKG